MTGRPLPRLGAWVKLPAAETVEVVASAGFDFVVIDAEHGAIDVRTMSTMIGLARGCGILPFVRVAGTAPRDVQVPLDAGAAGLFVPQVDDPDRARQAVAAARFPPAGRRGASPSGRAGRWGLDTLGDYLLAAGDVRLVVQAESPGALEAITEIGQVPGVDAVFVGPADLTVSGRFREDDPRLRRLLASAERRCADQAVTLGTAAAGDAPELLARGYSFLVLGADTSMLRQGAQAQLRAAGSGVPVTAR